MNIDPLVASVLAAVAILENSPDTEIDPDLAVQGMELMAHALADLQDEDAAEFVRAVDRIADGETNSTMRAFYKSVPTMLGIVG